MGTREEIIKCRHDAIANWMMSCIMFGIALIIFIVNGNAAFFLFLIISGGICITNKRYWDLKEVILKRCRR